MSKFKEVVEKNFKTLDQYVPIVAKVHGGTHPEFHDVKKLYDEINEKVKMSENPDLDNEFSEIRRITDNYTIPLDVCESYEAVYKMLEEVDLAYKG
ncbi:MAG: iron-sulfur cluster repair di-iron protein, ric [Tissierellia bacterium]|jgi:iron-sulfur cluster repair protein YtfE (RIC family)|nr:iron-sulfur cluster repair di-iron protein, ric [Tissierellia bacterium]